MKGVKRHVIRLALVLSVLLTIALLPAYSFAEEDLVDDTGRVYGKTFHTIANGGIIFDCYQYGENEAVVYRADAGIPGKVNIPKTIYDAVSEKERTIVGIISPAEVEKEQYSTGLYHYEGYSFGGNYEITELTLPSTLKFVGQGALYQSGSLKKVTFNSDGASSAAYTVEAYAFGGCTALTDVSFGTGDKAKVNMNAFSDCTALKSITFPAHSDISIRALEGCYNLEEVINSPYGLYLFSDYSDTFEKECPKNADAEYIFKLRKIVFQEGCEDITGIEQTDVPDQIVCTPYLKDVTIPSTAKSITGFDGTSIEAIRLPEGLTEIGALCFYECASLKTINFPSSVKIIAGSAFEGCTQLSGTVSLTGMEEVGEMAFAHCRNLKLSVKQNCMFYGNEYYDSGITDLTFKATDNNNDWLSFTNKRFVKCPNLKSITVTGSNKYFKSIDGVLYISFYDKETNERVWALLRYPPAKSAGNYTVPSSASLIAAYAFEGCKFSSIHIPVTVKGFEDLVQYENEDGSTDYPFSTMANKAPVYYVKNSYVDTGYIGGYYGNIKGISFKKYGNLKTEAGPQISISYDLGGGKNAAGNPASMTGGSTIQLLNPTRSGYEFVRWEKYSRQYEMPYEWSALDGSGNLTPSNEELVKGVKLRAVWQAVPSVGKTYKFKSCSYKILSAASGNIAGTAAFTKAKNSKSVTVPATVKIKGKSFKVTQINAGAFKGKKIRNVTIGKNVKTIKKNAFKGSKATTLTIKTTKLTKKTIKGCLKGSKIKTVKVKVGSSSKNKKYIKNYKKIFTKKIAGRKVTVKK